jgi:hypothetical protein
LHEVGNDLKRLLVQRDGKVHNAELSSSRRTLGAEVAPSSGRGSATANRRAGAVGSGEK